MLDFNLEISRDGTTFYSLDLFPDQQLDYDVDFYDSLSLDKIKLPFRTDMKLPLTVGNMGSISSTTTHTVLTVQTSLTTSFSTS